MVVMETSRLSLRVLDMADIDDMMSIWGDNEVMRYCGGAGTREQEERSLQFYLDLYADRGLSPFAVVLRETGELIGVAGFNPPSHECEAELMYHFKKAHWGHGYATEAASACVEYARKHPAIKTLGASLDPENTVSRRILERLGFESAGLRRCGATGKDEPYFTMKC